MLSGKTLYSQIFFNHIMGMAWLSFFVQKLTSPINLFDLVLKHRQTVIIFAFIFDFLIIKRFKWSGFLFVVLYELSKFYVFGDRFLGESLVVYAAVYLLGLTFEKFHKKKFSNFDYVAAGFFAWMIVFLREPYIPLALFLYAVFLWGKIEPKKLISAAIFIVLLLAVAINTNLSAFYFNDVTVNLATAIKGESSSNRLLGAGLFPVFLYPIFIFLYGKLNLFRLFEMSLGIVFIAGIVFEFFAQKKKLLVLSSVVALGFANIRLTPPGTVYYEAYHVMVWFGLFLFVTLLFSFEILKKNKKSSFVLYSIIFLGWGIAVFSPSSYLYDKINLQEQLLTNFGTEMNVGNVVNHLSNPKDTLFLDGADDTIYWVAKRYSPYPYSWYTGVMPQIPLYKEARIEMFRKNPPVFYYDYCSPKAPYHTSLPEFVRSLYQQLYSGKNPTCLYVLKKKLPEITSKQWGSAKEGFYNLP